MKARKVLLVADASAESLHGTAERMLVRHARALHAAGIPFAILSQQTESVGQQKVTFMEDVEEYHLSCSGGGRGWGGLIQLRHSARLWWKQYGAGFDLVVAEQPLIMWALMQAGCRLPYLQACYSFVHEEFAARHDLDWRWYHALAIASMRRLEAGLYRQATRLFVLSEYSRRRLGDLFGITEGVDVVRGGANPIDDALFSARQSIRTELGWKGPVAVTELNLVPGAGVDLLVQTAAICRYSQPELCWVVMGTGPLLEPLQRLAKEIGVDERIEFVGFIPDGEVRNRLVAADLLMLPTRSLEDFELDIAEANACGLPVVATPVGANVEVIKSLPSPNRLSSDVTPEALAQAVDDMLEEQKGLDLDAMRKELRASSLQFDWTHHDTYFLQCVREISE